MRYSVAKYAMQLADLVSATLSLIAVLVLEGAGNMPSGLTAFLSLRVTVKNLVLLAVFLIAWNLVLHLLGLYGADTAKGSQLRFKDITRAACLGTVSVFLFSSTSQSGLFRSRAAMAFLPLVWCGLIFNRILIRAFINLIERRGNRKRHCVIVGSGPLASDLYDRILQNSAATCYVAGFVDNPGNHPIRADLQPKILGNISDLWLILKDKGIEEVMIALPVRSCYELIQQVIQICEQVRVQCSFPTTSFNFSVVLPSVDEERSHPTLTLKFSQGGIAHYTKRLIDICGAFAGLALLSPLLLCIAVAVRLTSAGPVIFAQSRYGLNRQHFRMYKFRTMVQNAEDLQAQLESRNEASGPVFKIKEDPRITPLGRFLRKTSLDELPQLWNVLEGSMSLVGPRPLPLRDVSRFSEAWLLRRFSVKPGLTCLWQIEGRSNLDFEHWMQMDLQYIDRWSLNLDLNILLRTLPAVLKGQGAV